MKTLKLIVRHFAKVAKADIELNGVTVIVGENNSGKSTIGKALYSLCSVFGNLDERVRESRFESLNDAWIKFYNFLPIHSAQNLKERLLLEDFDEKSFIKVIEKKAPFFRNIVSDPRMEGAIRQKVKQLLGEVRRLRKITDMQYKEAVVWDYFDKVFHSQLLPLFPARAESSLEIINGDGIKVLFDSTIASLEKYATPSFCVCYINSPAIVNLLNGSSNLDALEIYDREIVEQLRRLQALSTDKVGIVAARKVSNRLKLKRLLAIFNRVIPGGVGKKGKGKLGVSVHGCREPISLENLSSGVKSFVVLWQVLDQGLLSDGDVLILDEPEVHLHPEWQIIYAELIVLMCQTFEIKVLLTSHSVDFIHALRLFVKKYNLGEQLRLYKSSIEAGGAAVINPVPSNDWNKLFDSFVPTISILEKIQASLPEDDSNGK